MLALEKLSRKVATRNNHLERAPDDGIREESDDPIVIINDTPPSPSPSPHSMECDKCRTSQIFRAANQENICGGKWETAEAPGDRYYIYRRTSAWARHAHP